MLSINLLPWRKKARRKRQQKIKHWIGASLFLLGILFLGRIYSFHHDKVLKVVPSVSAVIKDENNKTRSLQDTFIPEVPSFVMSDEKINHAALLTRTPLRELKWVGFLTEAKQTQAFLKGPTGETVIVKAGDRIGAEEAKVMNVTENAITFKTKNTLVTIPRSVIDAVFL